MVDFVEKLRNKRRKERLAREMTHVPQQPIYNPVGDALVQWGRGVKERATHPLETMANEAIRWRTMPIEQKAEEVAGMINPVGGLVGMFAGKGAKTANLAMLAKAEELKKVGIPDEQIWRETGWTFGFPDKKPRFEIPDNAARIMQDAPSQLSKYPGRRQSQIFSHDELYNAYPESADIWTGRIPGEYGGSYASGVMGKSDMVNIGIPNKNVDLNEVAGTNLHELQHAIQKREGFSSGGNYENASQYTPEFAQWESLRGSGTSQEEIAYRAIPNDWESYRRLAGEAEARLTQARMNLTPEQRLAQYPIGQFDVPVEQQIVRYGEGNAMSMPQENQTMAKLIKDMEDARAAYELQRAQRMQQMNQPSNALRNLAVGAGALGGGTAAGYYGMGMVE